MVEKKVSLASLAGISSEEMSRRIKEGQKKARSRGQHIGRKKTRNSELIRALLKTGMSQRKIAKAVGISHGTVHSEKILEQKEQVSAVQTKET